MTNENPKPITKKTDKPRRSWTTKWMRLWNDRRRKCLREKSSNNCKKSLLLSSFSSCALSTSNIGYSHSYLDFTRCRFEQFGRSKSERVTYVAKPKMSFPTRSSLAVYHATNKMETGSEKYTEDVLITRKWMIQEASRLWFDIGQDRQTN